MKSRDIRMDSLKGFLMVLVVMHHLIGQFGYGVGGVNWVVRSFIATFHMPLFILISGYYSRIKEDRKDFFLSLLKIAIPFIIFQLISIFLLYLTTGQLRFKNLVIPYWTLWYLLSLISWRIMLNYTPKGLLDKPLIYISIAVVFSVFSGFIPRGNLLSIQRTLSFSPFFLIGYYINKGVVNNKQWNNTLSYIFIIVLFVLIVLGFYSEGTRVILSGVGKYGIAQIPLKMVLLVCSYIISISFFNVFKENTYLAYIGRDSLFYYLYHGILIRFALYPIINYLELPSSFLYEMLYCGVIIVLIFFMGKLRCFRWLTNPISLSNK